MSGAINRHRARNNYRRHEAGLELLGADDAGAAGYANALAMLAQGAGEMASTQMAKQAAEKKAQDDKTAQMKKDNDLKDAELQADKLRAIAKGKANEAQLADLKAQSEKEPYGPLHQAALNAKNVADMADSEARKAEAKVAALKAGTSGSPESVQALQEQLKRQKDQGDGVPTWALVGGGVAGAGLLGWLIYKIFGKRKTGGA